MCANYTSRVRLFARPPTRQGPIGSDRFIDAAPGGGLDGVQAGYGYMLEAAGDNPFTLGGLFSAAGEALNPGTTPHGGHGGHGPPPPHAPPPRETELVDRANRRV